MRYYRITLTDQDDRPIAFASFSKVASSPIPLQIGGQAVEPGVLTSMLPDKQTTNVAALNVEMDIEQMATNVGNVSSFLRIYGLALTDIYRTDLNPSLDFKKYTKITVEVGMARGLPLANPNQRGAIVKGTVLQAFGNWMGTDMTLDIILSPAKPTGTPQQPRQYVFNWKKGQKLAEAIKDTISKSPLSDLQQDYTAVADDRVANADKIGVYETDVQFGQALQAFTEKQRSDTDPGVSLYQDGSTVIAIDMSNMPKSGGQNPKVINFEDLLGQVTWFEAYKMTCKVVMRGDLRVGGWVKFPKGALVETKSSAMTGLIPERDRDQLGIGSGAAFWIERIHHWGNFRQPDAMSWNTTLGLVQPNPASAPTVAA